MAVKDFLIKACCCSDTLLTTTCEVCAPTAKLCCFILSSSHWANSILLKPNSRDCNETTGENAAGNQCGRFKNNICGPQYAELTWGVSDDCSEISISLNGTVRHTSGTLVSFGYSASGLGYSWQGTSYTWSQSYVLPDGAGGTTTETITYTLRKCVTGDTGIWLDLPAELVTVRLDRLDGDAIGGMLKVYARGNALCGGNLRCSDTSRCTGVINPTLTFPWAMAWQYNIFEDTIDFLAACTHDDPLVSALSAVAFSVPYDNGNWIGILHSTIYSDELSTVYRIEDCDDTYACDPGCHLQCLKCPDVAQLAVVIEEDPSCCLHGTWDMYYNSEANVWQTWPPAAVGEEPTLPTPEYWIGGPGGICGLILWLTLGCSSTEGHVRIDGSYEDVNGGTFAIGVDIEATCIPSFATDYIYILSGLLSPGLCEGGIFKGAKLRFIAV